MKVIDLFNVRKECFENSETFAKRVYDTVKRYAPSLILNHSESFHIIRLLAKYYGEGSMDIISCIRDLEFNAPSKKYRIQWVQCLGEHYLSVEKR